MRPLRSVSADLLRLSRELAEATASLDPLSLHERALHAAVKQSESASLIVSAVAEHDHALALERLAAPCRCPHDLGDHLAEAPHRCDAVDVEIGDDGRERLNPCACPGFEHAPPVRSDTVPAASIAPETTPAPAMPVRLLERSH